MDVTPFLELRIAPRAVFDALPTRADLVRFVVPEADATREITWQQFADEIEAVAIWLLDQGVARGERVAIFATNRIEWMSAALAAQAIGAVVVPIYPSCTAAQAGYIVEHCEAKVVFTDEYCADKLDTTAVVARFDDGWNELVAQGSASPGGASRFEAAMDAVELDDVGLMLYTSGTTGPPKGVPLTHRNVAVNGRDWLEINGPLVEEGDVDILWLPMSHIFGFGQACLGNTLGWKSHVANPLTVLDELPRIRPHIFMSVPRYFEKIAQRVVAGETTEQRRELLHQVTGGRLRFCLSGGAGLKREVKELLWECGLLVVEGYGLTEASPTLTLNRPDAFRFDSVGKPLPSVELRLAEDGEIQARGESIFRGYHRDEAASAAAFTEDGWLKTGDLGRFTDDGFLQIIGRKKEILVTAGGKNVAPGNIELQFADLEEVAHCVVYGDGHKYLVAGFWLTVPASEEAEAWLAERVAEVNERVARFESIKRFRVMPEQLSVENGLLTPTLKVKRNQVYAKFRDEFEALYA